MENNIALSLVAYGDTHEELHIKDGAGLLVENGEQHVADIDNV